MTKYRFPYVLVSIVISSLFFSRTLSADPIARGDSSTEVMSYFSELRILAEAGEVSDLVRRPFVRELVGSKPDRQYVVNQLDGLLNSFGPWFLSEGRTGSYTDMLVRHHLIITKGLSGNSPYLVGHSGIYSRSDDEIVRPGELSSDGDSERLHDLAEVALSLRKKRFNFAKEADRFRFFVLIERYQRVGLLPNFLFNYVNYSLFMAQINFMFKFHGLNPIRQGTCDWMLISPIIPPGHRNHLLILIQQTNPTFNLGTSKATSEFMNERLPIRGTAQ